MSELKPCPHCGESLVEHADDHGTWWAHKNEPAPCAHGVTQLFDNEDFEAWNRRTPSLPASAEGGETTHRHKAQASTSEEMVERLRRALQGAKVVIGMMVRPEGLGQQLNEALDHRTAAIDAALKAETSR